MTPVEQGFLFLSAWLAQIVGTIAGFGSATILLPIAALFTDIKFAVPLVAVYHLAANAGRVYFFWRSIDWSVFLRFGALGIVCSVFGAALTARLSSDALELILGGFLVLFILFRHLAPRRVRLKPTTLTLAGGGAGSGLITGILGTGGAIRSACLLAFGLPKEVYLGTSAAIAFAIDLSRIPVYVGSGLLPRQSAGTLVGLVLAAFAGAGIGERLVRRIPHNWFVVVVEGMLALTGIKFLLDVYR